MRLLLVEDEKQLSEALQQILIRNKYSVDAVYNGDEGLDYSLTGVYDVIILDIMLPKLNGLEILKMIRRRKISTPVILLTAKDSVEDKILGLDSGADDYLPKPFSPDELLARLRALTRRNGDFINENIWEFWGFDSDVEHNNIEVYISFLRKKLAYVESNVKITTIRRVGYRLE